MTTRQAKALALYCQIGRKRLLRFTDRFSCVSGTRLTILTLGKFGLRFAPQSVKFLVQDVETNNAWSCGLNDEELAQASSVTHMRLKDGWRGHVVAVSFDRQLMLDSALDQADVMLGDTLGLRTVVYGFPFSKPLDSEFAVDLWGKTEFGKQLRLRYATTNDDAYLQSEAWKDQGLPLLADAIASEILTTIREGKSPVETEAISTGLT